MSLLNVDLPKWPGILVSGKKVTEEEAQNILIRTFGCWGMPPNDKHYAKRIQTIVGLQHKDPDGWYPDNLEEWSQKYKILSLSYLHTDRIWSAYIGGPYGWCNWNGEIKASSFNIGKWPTVEAVYEDWKIIAQEFPYLDLRCQLLDGETTEHSERDLKPLVEFVVKNAQVDLVEPKNLLMTPSPLSNHDMLSRLTSATGEQGLSEQIFTRYWDRYTKDMEKMVEKTEKRTIDIIESSIDKDLDFQ